MATSGAIEPASLTLAGARLSMRTPDDATIAAVLITKSSQPTWVDGAAPSSPEWSDLHGQGRMLLSNPLRHHPGDTRPSA